ncbi:MAG: hypothetical protein IJU98_00970 [Synergistaceae bacterium]|nr:hypothetical protein [Synergistaceae bacterium]
MPIQNATPLQERLIQAAIDYEPRFSVAPIVGPSHEERRAMKRRWRFALAGVAVMLCAYLFNERLGEWAFWLDAVGEVCVISAFISGLKYL